jgi:hypothetical protein
MFTSTCGRIGGFRVDVGKERVVFHGAEAAVGFETGNGYPTKGPSERDGNAISRIVQRYVQYLMIEVS